MIAKNHCLIRYLCWDLPSSAIKAFSLKNWTSRKERKFEVAERGAGSIPEAEKTRWARPHKGSKETLETEQAVHGEVCRAEQRTASVCTRRPRSVHGASAQTAWYAETAGDGKASEVHESDAWAELPTKTSGTDGSSEYDARNVAGAEDKRTESDGRVQQVRTCSNSSSCSNLNSNNSCNIVYNNYSSIRFYQYLMFVVANKNFNKINFIFIKIFITIYKSK